MSTLRQEFARRIAADDLLAGIERVYVGFSGGPDSTALLLLLQDQSVPAEAVYLHHGLRTEADRERDWCAEFCRRRGIPFRSTLLDVPAQRDRGESLEMAARRLRLRYWRERVGGREDVAVALGHHADDCLETLVLRLMRGSNTSGLTGLRAHRRIDGVLFIRPLLEMRRTDILALLAEAGIDDYCRDASNAELDIQRNRVRHEVLPLLRDLAGNDEGLRTTLANLRTDAACLEVGLDEAVVSADALSASALRRLPQAARIRFLQAWLTAHDVEPCTTALARLNTALTSPADPAARIDVGSGYLVREEEQALILEAAATAAPEWEYHWHWRRESLFVVPEAGLQLRARRLAADEEPDFAFAGAEFWPADELPPLLILRARQPGDRMVPFGSAHSVRLKKLVGQAGADARRHICVVCRPTGEILWVPGVRRVAGAVTESDRSFVELAFSTVRATGMAW